MEKIINMKNENIAESAISLIEMGIKNKHKRTILEAYDMVESEVFSWDGVDDSLYFKWDELANVANEVLYS